MNILIVGSGAREHAITACLLRSGQKIKLFCCGSTINPGIKNKSTEYWLGDICSVEAILTQAQNWNIELVIIGPEAPLEEGLADAFLNLSIPVVGPKKNLAKIETDKGYARNLMQKYRIPGLPTYQIFYDVNGVADFLSFLGADNYVVKANGLMGGKGVRVAGEHLHSFADAIQYCKHIFSLGQSVVIEEKLVGQEFSLMCFCDGRWVVPMPVVQDHKRAYVDDKGPNTGGMGSYSDANHSLPFLLKEDIEQALKINQSVIRALMQEEQDKYTGILYGGFIATRKGIHVIEFNARFGDPECLNVLTLLKSDFVDICKAMVSNNLVNTEVDFFNQASVCKYVVPHGYPEKSVKNERIDISKIKDKTRLYLASVDANEDGRLVTAGSRTAAVVGVADTIYQAEEHVEKEISQIDGPLFHRHDIGTAELINQRLLQMRKLRSI